MTIIIRLSLSVADDRSAIVAYLANTRIGLHSRWWVVPSKIKS